MRINLRHGATAAILAVTFGVLGPATVHAAAIGGSPAAIPAVVGIELTAPQHDIGVVQRDRRVAPAQPDQSLLSAADPCHQWDWWKYDSCRHDGNHCTFRADYVYHDKYGRYNEEGYYHCTEYPKPTPYAQSPYRLGG